LSLVKLRKALCQRVFNSYTSKIHPHDFKKTLNYKGRRGRYEQIWLTGIR
jgi:hypothetical protein